MKIIKHLTSLLFILLIFGCGKESGNNKDSHSTNSRNSELQEEVEKKEEKEEEQKITYPSDGSNIEGKYIARFTTLNPQVNGTLPGSVTFYREKDRVMVFLRLFAGYPKAWHPQRIYEGSRCPTLSDDTNGDGYIDILEAQKVLGKVLIPLDADISSQRSGRNFYPLGDLSGSYYYERMTSFSRLFRDLKDIKNASDEYKKLEEDEGTSIEGRAVLVQGVDKDIAFPETVGSLERYRPYQTLPIACGIFVSDNKTPGVTDNGEIPGPVADVEEGQDRPAQEGDGETQRDDPENRGDRTNDADSGNTPTVDSNGRSPTQPNPRPPRDYGDDSEPSDDEDVTEPSDNSSSEEPESPPPTSEPTADPVEEAPPTTDNSPDNESEDG